MGVVFGVGGYLEHSLDCKRWMDKTRWAGWTLDGMGEAAHSLTAIRKEFALLSAAMLCYAIIICSTCMYGIIPNDNELWRFS